MLCPYALKASAEQLNVLKVDDDAITNMRKFSSITTNINLKLFHTWGFPLYVLDARFQGNIDGLLKYEP